MFQLIQSIWMFGALGIIIPVIIHFWNRKQGKILKVGSISLLTESYKQQAKSLQLQERLLLLLRSLLILLVALLLSQPIWKEQLDPSKQQGWILIEKQGMQETYQQFKQVIDSLTGQHYEFHYFDTGFPRADLETALKNSNDSVDRKLSYWSLLSSLDQQVPASLPVFLFTPNSLNRFYGKRPEVSLNLRWLTYTEKDSVSAWLANAYLTTNDSIRLVAATSKPSGTDYSYTNTAVTSHKTALYEVEASADKIAVSYLDKRSQAVDTSTLKVTVYSDKYDNDVSYVKAALEAIEQYSKRKIQLSVPSNAAGIPHGQDWLFWLSDQTVPESECKNIFMYEKGKVQTTQSLVRTVVGREENEPIMLHKTIERISDPADQYLTIWQDGFGNPVLQLQKTVRPVYHFLSRFDPSWNDLPWSNAFPRMLYELILQERSVADPDDQRIMDEHQLRPVINSGNKTISNARFVKEHQLASAFWMAAFVVLMLERYLSFKTKKEHSNA